MKRTCLEPIDILCGKWYKYIKVNKYVKCVHCENHVYKLKTLELYAALGQLELSECENNNNVKINIFCLWC